MPNEATIVAASLDSSELENSINQLVKNFDSKLGQMMKDTDVAVSTIEQTFKRLNKVSFDSNGASTDNGASRRARKSEQATQAVKAEDDANKQLNLTLDQQAQAMQKAAASGKTYSEEVMRQARAIREMPEWKESGRVLVGDKNYYDPERENVTRQVRQGLLSLEEQIKQKLDEEAAVQQRIAQAGIESAQIKTREVTEEERKLQITGSIREILEKSRDIMRAMAVESNTTNTSFVAKLESANRLNEKLKELRKQYSDMNYAQRNSEEGKKIAQDIRMVTRELQKLQAQASRPANIKEALGLSEKSLDDIAYKIRQLQSYKQGINLVDPKSASELRMVDDSIKRLKKDMESFMGTTKQTNATLNALTRSLNYMKNRLAFYFTVGATQAFVRTLIDIRAQYEMNERALGILIDSAERGTQIFKELSQMALVSPYTLIELSSAAKQLTAYDIAAKDVVDTTRRLADMAAAVGIPIERLTYALGQIKAYGYLNSRDNRMFANAGIPLVRQLADYYTELEGRLVSTADVYDRIKKKAVDYNDVMQVINRMTDEGGRFFDFQAKMAETLKVQLANLTLAWNNALNDIGKDYQGWLSGAIGVLKELFLHWRTFGKILGDVIVSFGVYKGWHIAVNLLLGKGTYAIIQETNALKGATAASYSNALATQKLSNAQAALLFSFNRSNVALKEALINMRLLTAAQASAIVSANKFKLAWYATTAVLQVAWGGVKTLGVALKTLMLNPMTWWIGGLTALAELWQFYGNRAKEVEEANKSLAEGAKESAKSISEFLKSEQVSRNRNLNEAGKLGGSELEKTWESIREEIDKSALSNNQIIEQLLDEEDLAKRVAKAFDFSESLKNVGEKLSGIENELEISKDGWAWGLFGGEGLETDVRQYTEAWLSGRKKILETYKEQEIIESELQRLAQTGFNYRQMEQEMSALADNIAEILRARNITNPTEVAEAVARIKQVIKQQSPEIKGEVEKIFDIDLDARLASRIKGYDKTSAAVKLIMEQLRKDSSHVFQGITQKTEELEQKQKDAISAVIDKLKKELPPNFGNVLDTLQSDLQNRDWVIRIRTAFASPEPSWLESDLKKRLPLTTVSASTEENLTSFLDKQRKDRKAALDEMADMRKAGLENTQHYFDVEKTAKEATEVLKAYNSELEKTKEKSKTSQKDKILDALKQEIDLVKKLQGEYDKLVKSGAAIPDALEAVGNAFGNTIKFLNAKLQGFNIPQIDLKTVLTGDPNKTLTYFENLRRDLEGKGLLNLERSKAIEVVIEELKVKAKTYNLDMITKGLNNELGRLKDEYELAIALDADPEMGGVFADMFDIHMEDLPRTAEQYAKELTKSLNKYLEGMGSNLNISDILSVTKDDLKAFEEQVKNSQFNQVWLDKIREVYKAARDVREKESKETIKGWQDLLKKYGEYEAKIAEVQKNATRERVTFVKNFGNADQKSQAIDLSTRIAAATEPEERLRLVNQLKELVDSLAGDDELRLKLKTSIDEHELQETARIAFEEFQKSPQWITATGDLAGMSDQAIKSLIKDIEDYKKSARNLSPKQIKEMNRALKALYKQQREGNPFKFMSNIMDEAKSRMANYNEAIADTEKKIEGLIQKRKKQGGLSDEETNQLNGLIAKNKELHQAQEEAGEINTKDVVAGLQACFDWASQCVTMFSNMADALMGEKWSEAKENLNDVMSTMQSGLQGAQMGAAVGGGYGAIIGGAAGLIMGAITAFSGNADKKIVAKIEESERAVKKLDNEIEILKGDYDAVTFAAERSYGAQKAGAEITTAAIKETEMATKRLQLAELRRQLQLERSRDSKKRDEDKIVSISKEIISMENELRSMEREVSTAISDIVDDLLGISRGSWAEELTDALISAFKAGEDYMNVFSESWEEMVQNMVVKTIAAKVIGDALEKNVLSRIEEIENQETSYYRQQQADLAQHKANLQNLRLENQGWWFETISRYKEFPQVIAKLGEKAQKEWQGIQQAASSGEIDLLIYSSLATPEFTEKYGDQIEQSLFSIYDNYNTDIDNALKQAQQTAQERALREVLTGTGGAATKEALMQSVSNVLPDMMKTWGIQFGQDADKTLSALQQGIQGITEDTANSIEAYLNIVSQRMFYHGTLLEEIRDTVQSIDYDIQTSIQAQILLQLQQSYAVQMAIQSILEGTLNASGRAFAVELVS